MENLDTRIKKLEKKCAQPSFKAVILKDGETQEEARERAGLTDWRGLIIYIKP